MKATPKQKQPKKVKQKQKEEKINWNEIMGMNKTIYKRGPGGALRRK
jgi:hypothetical protein